MPSFRIVPATREHVPGIMAIYNAAILDSTATFDTEPKSLAERYNWLEGHSVLHPVLAAIDDQGSVVGWGSLSPYAERLAYRFTVEDSLYISSDWQGRGVGSAMLAALLDLAKANGFHSVVAKITGGNASSVHLHEKFGFAIVANLREVGFKFDRWLDVTFMQKIL